MIEFKGDCKGVRLEPRGENDNHILVVLLTEDDGNWYEGEKFSSAWIDELISKLKEAQNFIKTQKPDIHNGEQYGYKFNEIEAPLSQVGGN